MLLEKYMGDQLEPITLIGLHAGNNNLLYEDSEGKTQQERSRLRCIRVVTAEEMLKFEQLKAAVTVAEEAVRTWVAARRIDPIAAIYKALGMKRPRCDGQHSRSNPCHEAKCYLRDGMGGDDDE